MSSGYMYDEEFAENQTARTIGNKKLKFLLAVIVLILGAQLVWFFGLGPCMPFAKITISGISGIDEKAVLALAGIGKHSSYLTVNARSAEKALLALPMIRSAGVIKQFPNRLEIR
ncbi:MAG: FtsQ-type POTRA domain-containing protein, partial [Treponema sp.]|nr:FtsQ-type POTRA domain-containing protein [Treponema sp.]